MKVIVIGGVAGGASAAARIRRLDEKQKLLCLKEVNMYLIRTAAFRII